MVEASKFTWVQTHKEIVQYLKNMKDRQPDLISELEKAGVDNFTDRDVSGETFKLNEMEPFTFFFYIYKYGEHKRLQVLQNLAKNLGLTIPGDTDGVPSANAISVRIFPQKDIRTHDEVNRLWVLFHKTITHSITDVDFQDALNIVSVGKAKLTEAFFMVDPEYYLCIDGQTRPYLKEVLRIDPKFNTYSEYIAILHKVKEKTDMPFPELSFAAWIWNTKQNQTNYWVFQCNPNIYDIVPALRGKMEARWRVAQHTKDIKVGDRVILWVTGPQAGCYALGEINGELEYGVRDIEDQKYYKDDSFNVPSDRVLIKLVHNLVDRPVLKSAIEGIKTLNDLNAGLQGTNFSATEKQFKTLEKLALAAGPSQSPKRYWIFSPGHNAEKWEEFYSKGYMAIGWTALGDLNQYNSQEEIEARLQELSEQDEVKKNNNALANWQFKTEMKPGDIVIAKLGRKILLGYGEVNSGYYFDSTLDYYQKCRKVNWMLKGEWSVDHSLVMKTLTDITDYSSDHPDYKYYYQRLMAAMGAAQPESEGPTNGHNQKPVHAHPLNLILFGPPGTGKTYNTINKAVAIADSISEEELERKYPTRKDLTTRYRQLVDEKRIVFTTFHQSMSYEDFIEGIKPVTYQNNHGSIGYEVVEGIFKRLCFLASQSAGEGKTNHIPTDESRGVRDSLISGQEFGKLFDLYLQTLPPDSETEHSKVVLFSSNRNNPFEVFRTPDRHTIVVRAGNQRYANSIAKKELVSVFNNEKEPYYPSYEPVLIKEILKLRGTEAETFIDDSFDQAYSRLCTELESMTEPVMKVKTPNGTEFGISLNGNGNLTVHTAPEFRPSVTITRDNIYSHAIGENVPPYDKGYFLGVLRLLHDKYGFTDSTPSVDPGDKTGQVNFDKLYAMLIEEIRDKLANNERYILHTKLDRPREVIKIIPDNKLIVRGPDNRTYEIDVPALRKLFFSGKDPNTTLSKDIDELTGKWHSSAYRALWSKIVQISNDLQTGSTDGSKIDIRTSSIGVVQGSIDNTQTAPYVLIIDEINRGNVSQIFGELITLIEVDKRAGMPEALETVLPYSKESFSVPSNLHIIGTMNTADRSVEALDTALRRRFSFCEMIPDYSLLRGTEAQGIDLADLLATINQRIEGLLDKDHAIGHSYFLRVAKGESTLEDVFFDEIIPLLQEYFYGNFGRIELVLGGGFVKSSPITQSIFAKPSPDNDEFNNHIRYSLVRREEMDETAFQKALRVLMNESDEAQ